MKKTIVLILSIMLLFIGCEQKKFITSLWEQEKQVPYDETIISFMINPENKSLIFIGQKYHYIFNPNEKFSYLYDNKNENITFDSTNGTYETRDDKVLANFSAYLYTKNLNQEIIDWALKNGGEYTNKTKEKIKVRISLNGTRYLANEEVNKVAEKLSTELKIKINDIVPNDLSTASKIALTPLALSGDIVMAPIIVFGAGAVILLFVPVCVLAGFVGQRCM